MKHTLLGAAATWLLLGCSYHKDEHHHDAGSDPVPAFAEIEPNDFVDEVDHFGVIVPGDHFAILGNVRNDSLDPADGFGFTAAQPIHVEFRLLATNSFADMSVGLFDPQLGETVFTYQTGSNPELGSVDVFAGDVDFHLVVVTSLEPTDYDLELQVFPFQPAARAEAGSRGVLAGHAASVSEDVAEDLSERLRAYGEQDEGASTAGEGAVLERVHVLELTPGSETARGSFVLTTDGRWMGIPGGPSD